MIYAVYVVLGFVVLGAPVSLIWRVVSHRQALPCPSWLGWMVELDNPLTRVNHAQFIVDHLELGPGMRVLDAGCGPGRVTLPLADLISRAARAYDAWPRPPALGRSASWASRWPIPCMSKKLGGIAPQKETKRSSERST